MRLGLRGAAVAVLGGIGIIASAQSAVAGQLGFFTGNGYPVYQRPGGDVLDPVVEYTNVNHELCKISVTSGGWAYIHDYVTNKYGYTIVSNVSATGSYCAS
jgi:hypothetical protein